MALYWRYIKMAAQLIAVDGSRSGVIHDLDTDDLSIGRDHSNSLCLNDRTVSRNHCVLQCADRVWRIRDLESRNGTFVNGLPVKERILESRDEIKVGAAQFLFLKDEEWDGPVQSNVDPESVPATRTVLLSPEEPPSVNVYRFAASLALEERNRRELSALLEISAALAVAGDLETIKSRMMEHIFASLPAARGAVLLTDAETGELEVRDGWDRDVGTDLRRIVAEGSARLLEPAGRAGALLAAPLVTAGAPLGVLALESTDKASSFDEGHLEWLAAVAVMASPAIASLRRLEWLEAENGRLASEINRRQNMVGESPAMQEVLRQIGKASGADSTVLIRGETGTGKELVARAIHAGSPRSGRLLVAVNCATLSETLIESDLFGHEKGAFTGAIAQKKGKIEMAEGGTLFLDEIGELAAPMQAKLLRVLQEREYERVGGLRPLRADIRLIAATNRDLEEAVKAGTFRQDLFYRLNVIVIQVPPLRERPADIPLLASYFCSRFSEKASRRIAGISPAARHCLCAHDWPGNVRELENAIERAVVLGSTDLIELEDLPETVVDREATEATNGGLFHDGVRDAKRRLILMALGETNGNHQEAARRLGLNPTYLSRLIRNLNLKAAVNASGE